MKTKDIIVGDTSFRSVSNSRVDRFYYLCTPYTKYKHGLETAYQMAAQMTMYLQMQGFFIYCPIVHSHTPSNYCPKSLKESHDFWLTIDKQFVKISRGLIVCKMQGWDESKGIQIELDYAKELDLPVYYTDFLEVPKELL